MKKKFYKKIIAFSLVALAIISFSFISFATNNESNNTEDEAREFYSKFVESENTNEGVKVVIVKSDKYGDLQDEYVAVDVKLENLNRYSDLEINVEAIDHEEFKITNKNRR